MRNISFGQFLVVSFICFLLFGDYGTIKKKVNKFVEKLLQLRKKNKKKRIWTLDFWFWKPLFYQLNYFLFMIYKSYYFEIKNRFILLLLIWLFCSIVTYIYKETLMFSLKPDYLSNYKNIFKFYFIFTDVREVFSAYVTIIFFVSNQIFVFSIIYQTLNFFSSGLYYTEYLQFKKFICLSFFFWISSIFFFNTILLPVTFDFFLSFQNLTHAGPVQMYFESKLIEYLDFYIVLYFVCGLYGQILLFLIFFLNSAVLNLKTIKKYRKPFFLFFLLFSTATTPPDVVSQILLTFSLSLLYELLNFVNLTKKYWKKLIG